MGANSVGAASAGANSVDAASLARRPEPRTPMHLPRVNGLHQNRSIVSPAHACTSPAGGDRRKSRISFSLRNTTDPFFDEPFFDKKTGDP